MPNSTTTIYLPAGGANFPLKDDPEFQGSSSTRGDIPTPSPEEISDFEVVYSAEWLATTREGDQPSLVPITLRDGAGGVVDVLEVEWEGGVREWYPVTSLNASERGLEVPSAPGQREPASPVSTTLRDGSGPRIQHTRLLRVVEGVADRMAGNPVDYVAEREKKRQSSDRLVRCPLPHELDQFSAKEEENKTLDEPGVVPMRQDGPNLMFIHGTAADFRGSFGHMVGTDEWKTLRQKYSDHLYTFEHHTLHVDPVSNAIHLLKQLPDGARLHLLTQSRGGLVGDLLACVPRSEAEINTFCQHYLGLFPERQNEVERFRTSLIEFMGLLHEKNIVVERMIRVACPSAGTPLASERSVEVLLNLLALVPGGVYWQATRFLLKSTLLMLFSTGTLAHALPGLMAMSPNSPLGYFLGMLPRRDGSELAVVSGDASGGGLWRRLRNVFLDWVIQEDNDLVIPCQSMFKGLARTSAVGYLHRSADINHLTYFKVEETRRLMARWLLDQPDLRWRPLHELSRPELREQPLRSPPLPPSIVRGEDPAEWPTLFVIPGIMGSHLAVGGEGIWLEPWQLMQGGIQKLIFTKGQSGVIPTSLVASAYARLIRYMSDTFKVVPFPYDWRRDILDNARLLAQAIRQDMEKGPPGRRVVLLAHSLGGLVSRGVEVVAPDVWQEIQRRNGRLVMLGTPNHGSWTPAQILAGQELLVKLLATSDLVHDTRDFVKIVSTFPGLLQMLPQEGPEVLDNLEAYVPDWTGDEATKVSIRTTWESLARAVDSQRMVYVAGQAHTTPKTPWVQEGKLRFGSTTEGDGRVPWSLGVLEGVSSYLMEGTSHGDLCDEPRAFLALWELCESGSTDRLPRLDFRRATRGGGEMAPMEADYGSAITSEPITPLGPPSSEDLLNAALGRTAARRAASQATRLKLVVALGDLGGVEESLVMLGHFEGESLSGPERMFDLQYGGLLSRDVRLGIYPEKKGTSRYYDGKQRKGRSCDQVQVAPPSPKGQGVETRGAGLLVIGLGVMGELSREQLHDVVKRALFTFALDKSPRDPIAIDTLLMGTQGGLSLRVEDSLSAQLDAVLVVNREIRALPPEQQVAPYSQLRIVEHQRALATRATHIARQIAIQTSMNNAVEGVEAPQCLVALPGASLDGTDVTPLDGYVQRAFITLDDDHVLHFTVLTDMARSEEIRREIQWPLVQETLQSALSPQQQGAAHTLCYYLLPQEFINPGSLERDLLLVVDREAATIPWELLHRELATGQPPIAARVGVLRQLKTPHYRTHPTRARRKHALVIGEPLSTMHRLEGALREAGEVGQCLEKYGYEVNSVLRKGATEILRQLYEDEYDILHITGHGTWHPTDIHKCGVVLENGHLITSGELENLRAVPSIVFINCCHLGRIAQGSLNTNPTALSASLAETLINMGVRVVVAAGWAVDDVGASTFATTFYSCLQQGMTLIEAVRRARRWTWEQQPTSSTWGAYQVYGDPGYSLLPADEPIHIRSLLRPLTTMVAPHELATTLRQIRDLSMTGDKKELLDVVEEFYQLAPRELLTYQTLLTFGEIFVGLGQKRRAREVWSRALTQAPDPWLDLTRALSRLEEGDGEGESEAWKELSQRRLELALGKPSPSTNSGEVAKPPVDVAPSPLGVDPVLEWGGKPLPEDDDAGDEDKERGAVAASDFKFIGRGLTREEFTAYVETYNFGSIPPDFVILHHTAIPGSVAAPYPGNKTQWDTGEQGLTEAQIYQRRLKKLTNIKEYYRTEHQWSRGPHLFIDDKWIWLFTPMDTPGIHAKEGNKYTEDGKLHYSVGIEVVGYYEKLTWPAPVTANVGHAVAVLRRKLANFRITYKPWAGGVSSHRDYNKPTCPGAAITEAWYIETLRKVYYDLVGTRGVDGEEG